MKLTPTQIPDVVLLEPQVFEDERGWFMESFHEAKFHAQLQSLGLPIPSPFVQDNTSHSKLGVLRGLHYQLPPHEQGKLVSVTQGRAFDVAVDIRKNSPTFGQWVGFELSAANKKMLWIPAGFAHGFLALEDHTQFFYKVTNFYSKTDEACIRWDDPQLAIQWPMVGNCLLHPKDQAAPLLKQAILPPATRSQLPTGLIHLTIIGDERGELIALEKSCNLPFDLKRVYYILNTKAGVSRGFHAHKHLTQVAVCLTGSCRMVLDDGFNRQEYLLNSPTQGLMINEMVWREMHDFSSDCILVVFASEKYNEADYIRDYESFKQAVRKLRMEKK